MPNMQEIEQLINFCKVMASSPFYQKLGPGGVMAVYLTAKERDLPFMACLNGGLHSVEGKITYSGIMIDSLIKKSGHKTKLLHLDSTKCTIRFTRCDTKNDPDYEPFDFTYTIEDARIAGYLTKNNWKQNPKPMLYNRCVTGGGRMHIPEVFLGVLLHGELVGTDSDGDIVPQIPEHSMHEIEEFKNSIPQIEFQPTEDYLQFCDKFNIDKGTLSMEYVEKIAALKRKEPHTIIQAAMKNESGFNEAFEKWKADQGKPAFHNIENTQEQVEAREV